MIVGGVSAYSVHHGIIQWGNVPSESEVPADLNPDDIVDLSVSPYLGCAALKSDGSTVLWGPHADDFGFGDYSNTAISSGAEHHMVLRTDGSVGVCGNYDPVLGVPSAARSDVVAISAGAWHCLSL